MRNLVVAIANILLSSVALAGCLVAWGQSQIAVPSGRFLYVNDNLKNQNAIEAFVVMSNGALIRLAGSPFMTRGKGDHAGAYTAPRITLGATGNFLYVANEGSGDISTFKIDSNTGIPTVEGTPQSTGGSGLLYGIGLAASPDGKFLFAGNGSTGNIGAFSLGLDGRLKTVSGSPFTAGGSPDGVKVTPDSKFLMVALPGDYGSRGEIVVFAIASDGSLSQVAGSPFSTYGRPAGLDIDCSGKYLFVGDATTGAATVEVYAIGASGALTAVPGSPFLEYSALNSNGVLLSPDDTLLYVTNQQSETATSFAVASDGSLTVIAGGPFSVGSTGFPTGESIDPSGKFLFVGIQPGSPGVAVLTSTDGVLTPVPGSPFATLNTSYPQSLAVLPAKRCQ